MSRESNVTFQSGSYNDRSKVKASTFYRHAIESWPRFTNGFDNNSFGGIFEADEIELYNCLYEVLEAGRLSIIRMG